MTAGHESAKGNLLYLRRNGALRSIGGKGKATSSGEELELLVKPDMLFAGGRLLGLPPPHGLFARTQSDRGSIIIHGSIAIWHPEGRSISLKI
jgi:hypothetical protein